MELTTERENDVLSIRVIGRIDGSNAIAFQEAIRAHLEDRDRAMVMDCAELTYISSAGLRVVLVTAKALTNRNMKFALCALTEHVLEAFETSGFDKIMAIHSSRAAAMVALGNP